MELEQWVRGLGARTTEVTRDLEEMPFRATFPEIGEEPFLCGAQGREGLHVVSGAFWSHLHQEGQARRSEGSCAATGPSFVQMIASGPTAVSRWPATGPTLQRRRWRSLR